MKKLFISAAIVVVVGVAGSFASHVLNPNRGLTPTQIANIEALADSENGSGDTGCHYTNGYKRWKTERPWWWSDEEAFYDCCVNLTSGYSPYDSCN